MGLFGNTWIIKTNNIAKYFSNQKIVCIFANEKENEQQFKQFNNHFNV